MKKILVTFIATDFERDIEWIIKSLPTEFDANYLNLSSTNDPSNRFDPNRLYVYLHDWTTGRLDPPTVSRNFETLNSRGFSVYGLMVFRTENDKGGTEVALISLRGVCSELTAVYVGIRKLCDPAAFSNKLKTWYSDRPKSITATPVVTPSQTTNPRRAATSSTFTYSQPNANPTVDSIILAQQKRIDDLENQVRALTQRLEQVEAKLEIQSNQNGSTKSSFRNLF